MKKRYILLFIGFFIAWNYASAKFLGGGMGYALSVLESIADEERIEARSHPNQIVGASRDLITIPFKEFMMNIIIFVMYFSPPLFLTFLVYSHFNIESGVLEYTQKRQEIE